MKARELIEVLRIDPNADVLISVDVSTNENEYDKRAFANTDFDYQIRKDQITLMFEGYLNNET